ncbi:hypothetical protein EDB84DRAFT_1584049, partial [Lactarius hengduanensis]
RAVAGQRQPCHQTTSAPPPNPLPPSRGSCSKAQQLRRHLKTAAPAPATSPPLKTPPSRRGRRPHLDVATRAAASTRLPPQPPPATQRSPRRGRLVTTPTTASTASSRPLSLPRPSQCRRRRYLDSANPAPAQHNAIPLVTTSSAPPPTSATSTGTPAPPRQARDGATYTGAVSTRPLLPRRHCHSDPLRPHRHRTPQPRPPAPSRLGRHCHALRPPCHHTPARHARPATAPLPPQHYRHSTTLSLRHLAPIVYCCICSCVYS